MENVTDDEISGWIMREFRTFDAPVDLLQAARDELIDGRCCGHLAPQPESQFAGNELLQPPRSQHCDTEHREVVAQAAVFPRETA